MEKLSKEDIDLKGLIQEHLEETESVIAREILADWDTQLKNFKSNARDYKRVLLERVKKAKEQEALA